MDNLVDRELRISGITHGWCQSAYVFPAYRSDHADKMAVVYKSMANFLVFSIRNRWASDTTDVVPDAVYPANEKWNIFSELIDQRNGMFRPKAILIVCIPEKHYMRTHRWTPKPINNCRMLWY